MEVVGLNVLSIYGNRLAIYSKLLGLLLNLLSFSYKSHILLVNCCSQYS